MLADNIVLMKKQFPQIYQRVKNWEESKEETLFNIEKARDGNDTLRYHEKDQAVYIHSKYNPIREAETIIDKLEKEEEITNETLVVFYGLGLGYHVEEFVKRYPDVSFLVIEPIIEVLAIYLNQKRLKRLPLKNLLSIQAENNVAEIYNASIQSKKKNFVICELPIYPKLFKIEYENFLINFINVVKAQRSSLNINYSFKKRWILNSVNNFKVVLKTPNILMCNRESFTDKTAILVSAGPSLDFEIENLKKVKKHGLAYIFSVGTSINTLVHHEIYPHAMCTYDPTENNQLVFKKINELNINSIPMIFGSSVGYEVLEQYKGPKLHTITTQDTVSEYFLSLQNHKLIEKVSDAPSIAVVTFELLAKLGFKRIILVGQNLSFTNRKIYASGVTHRSNDVDGDNFTLHSVESVQGDILETSEALLQMKKQLEETIKKYNVEVINTTVNGAKITGAEFTPFSNLFDEILNKKNVEENEINIQCDVLYDKNELKNKLKTFKSEYSDYQKQIFEIKQVLMRLNKVHDVNNSNTLLNLLNQSIKEMETNDFFKVISLPINRVEYDILENTANGIRNEKNVKVKIKKILEPTEVFIDLLLSEMKLNDNIISVLSNVIEGYIRE
ncbi:MAG: hypothetical protein CVU99_05145 [Firmicutes bacterium HGW-Firmicutes-4]|nr:MAG: hypothetical protein CVU99_05145 [Firmicutes bacterium HGW-Firmicutes-4]